VNVQEEGTTAGTPNTPAGGEPTTLQPGETPPGVKPVEGETKPGEAKPGETKPGEAKPGETKPGEVEYKFEFPDGLEVDPAEVEAFKGLAKELKLDAPTAQKIASYQAARVQAQMAKHAAEVEKWRTDSQTDKEFGGDAFKENLAGANKVLAELGTPELKAMLIQSKLANHPEVIRFMHRVNKFVAPDTFVKAGSPSAMKSAADTLYGG
jgi:hypothetical protein